MKTHKTELIAAGILLLAHIIMMGINKYVTTHTAYWIVLELCLAGSVILGCRVAWEKFKETLAE